jgi:hypothetical protein
MVAASTARTPSSLGLPPLCTAPPVLLQAAPGARYDPYSRLPHRDLECHRRSSRALNNGRCVVSCQLTGDVVLTRRSTCRRARSMMSCWLGWHPACAATRTCSGWSWRTTRRCATALALLAAMPHCALTSIDLEGCDAASSQQRAALQTACTSNLLRSVQEDDPTVARVDWHAPSTPTDVAAGLVALAQALRAIHHVTELCLWLAAAAAARGGGAADGASITAARGALSEAELAPLRSALLLSAVESITIPSHAEAAAVPHDAKAPPSCAAPTAGEYGRMPATSLLSPVGALGCGAVLWRGGGFPSPGRMG